LTKIVALRGSQEVVALAENVALVIPMFQSILEHWVAKSPCYAEEFVGAAIGRNEHYAKLIFRWAVCRAGHDLERRRRRSWGIWLGKTLKGDK